MKRSPGKGPPKKSAPPRHGALRPDRKVEGIFESRSDGSGFVRLEGGSDRVDIPMGRTLGALTGDRVTVVYAAVGGGRQKGPRGRPMLIPTVERLIDAAPRIVVGTLLSGQSVRVLVPDGRKALGPLLVDGVERGVPSGVKAVVEIGGPNRGSGARPTTAKLLRILGDEHDPKVLLEAIEIRHGLVREFGAMALAEAEAAAGVKEPDTERRDLGELCVFTIDPADARDFDDAVSLELCPEGFELGVHIADVASYVQKGSALDGEARQRGTSVYLPGRVVPMLPEALSNGACSLREKEPRRTLSAFLRFDSQGHRTAARFERTVIRSRRRLTYEQAQQAIDGAALDLDPAVGEALGNMAVLSRRLLARRGAEGMLNLDLPEVELVLGPNGGVVDARPKPALLTHRLIEMFMVEANEAVAERLCSLGIATLRRIHEPPTETHLIALSQLARSLGFELPEAPTRLELCGLLSRAGKGGTAFPLHYAVLRSLTQARYSPLLEGHYALASRHYCHFTSPIRRYPDLVVHRALTDVLLGFPPSESEAEVLEALADQCSTAERRAAEIERDARTALILLHLEPRIGEEFEGIISSITERGMFVQWPRYLVDGMVRYEDFGGQWWEPTPLYGMVKGELTGQVMRVGDPLRVQLAAVSPSDGRMDLRPVVQAAPKKAAAAPKSARGPRRESRRRS